MGISVFPAPSAASKTRFFKSLTSSSSFTVPTGVTYLNVTCIGGGGGAGGAGTYGVIQSNDGAAGGTTTFSTLSASGGALGRKVQSTEESGYNGPRRSGTSASANSGLGGTGGYMISHGISFGTHGSFNGGNGQPGQILSDIITVTPGQVISYTIGAGGAGGASSNATYVAAGGDGGSGRIDIEYWA